MLRGQIRTNFPPEYPRIAIFNCRIRNGRRIVKKFCWNSQNALQGKLFSYVLCPWHIKHRRKLFSLHYILGVALAVVSAVAGCAMVTVTVRTPQTSVTVQMFRAELTGSVATMATAFCRNGSVMVEEIVMMLQTNKVQCNGLHCLEIIPPFFPAAVGKPFGLTFLWVGLRKLETRASLIRDKSPD